MRKQMVHFLTASVLLALPVLAQPAPPGGPRMAPPSTAQSLGLREMEGARREIARAQYLASIIAPATLKQEADALLQQAQQDYQAQAYFRARERARAAGTIYQALRFLEVAPGYTSRGRKAYQAPYRAQEAIARVEYEAGFYGVNQPLVSRLLEEAKRLLASGSDLARAEAAHQLARAAHHLIKAERGF
ncbi:hypothetical protein [Thermus sediminis]|uniref:hypothetical protein n=1 Tax=Thermus sediminis TaxID=1761908 RepID=UPI001E64D756|nr:hypothetical protein [Thermus sediminis]